MVYDVTQMVSLEHCLQWKKEIDDVVYLSNGDPIPIVLIANKVLEGLYLSSLAYITYLHTVFYWLVAGAITYIVHIIGQLSEGSYYQSMTFNWQNAVYVMVCTVEPQLSKSPLSRPNPWLSERYCECSFCKTK